MTNSLKSLKDLEVIINGKKITLAECALLYNIDLNLLISEYLESGDINNSIVVCLSKQLYVDNVRDYIYNTPLGKVKKTLSFIKDTTSNLKNQKIEVLKYVYHTADEVLELTLDDLISLLVDFNIDKPVIDSKYKEIVDYFITFCNSYNKDVIKIDKKYLIELINILEQYKLSTEDNAMLFDQYSASLDKNYFYKVNVDNYNEYKMKNIEIDEYSFLDNLKLENDFNKEVELDKIKTK